MGSPTNASANRSICTIFVYHPIVVAFNYGHCFRTECLFSDNSSTMHPNNRLATTVTIFCTASEFIVSKSLWFLFTIVSFWYVPNYSWFSFWSSEFSSRSNIKFYQTKSHLIASHCCHHRRRHHPRNRPMHRQRKQGHRRIPATRKHSLLVHYAHILEMYWRANLLSYRRSQITHNPIHYQNR